MARKSQREPLEPETVLTRFLLPQSALRIVDANTVSRVSCALTIILSHNRFRGLFLALLSLILGAAITEPLFAQPPSTSPSAATVDASSLRHKVLCGYQGWFRCPNDPAREGWRHWSRDGRRIAPETLTFEMWPDMTDYDADERYPAPGFAYPDGAPAQLFSSANCKTVARHFDWMRHYGIDGVFLQRFLVELHDPSVDMVLAHVRESARRTGRTYALCYDMSGAAPEKIVDLLVSDWKRLVDQKKVTHDERYLRHNGKPVLFVWGFYSDRFGPELAERLIDLLRHESRYQVTLVGGCQWWWRRETNPGWARVFRRFDVLSPWNTGNAMIVDGRKHAATIEWKDDLAEARRGGFELLPVIYPGFGWTNLKGPSAAKNNLPRLGGEFFWRQFSTAAELGVEMAYVAMFDEVDEGTAIFKVTNSPPKPGRFAAYEGRPADWYLRLTGEGTKLLRGERKNSTAFPIMP